MIERCECCGAVFKTFRCRVAIGKGRYCSRRCANIARSEADYVAQRFWSKVDKSGGPSSCWLWVAGRDSDGYGKFRLGASTGQERAHRLVYKWSVGPIPDGYCVLHHCDTPACVNPSHLFIGTLQDNEDDKTRKGRRPVGAATHKSKLAPEDVVIIRGKYTGQRGELTELAREHGVTIQCIRALLTGMTWRWCT